MFLLLLYSNLTDSTTLRQQLLTGNEVWTDILNNEDHPNQLNNNQKLSLRTIQ